MNEAEDGLHLELRAGVVNPFGDLVLDYTGTLSLDGKLLPRVAERFDGISPIDPDHNPHG